MVLIFFPCIMYIVVVTTTVAPFDKRSLALTWMRHMHWNRRGSNGQLFSKRMAILRLYTHSVRLCHIVVLSSAHATH